MTETQLLRDPGIEPAAAVLKSALGKVYPALERLQAHLAEQAMEPQWRYYNDGKAWLCKVVYKKKTVMWLSVWERYFKTSFFFTEKTRAGVSELDIDQSIKDGFAQSEATGKLIPLIINIEGEEQLADLYKIMDYKKSL